MFIYESIYLTGFHTDVLKKLFLLLTPNQGKKNTFSFTLLWCNQS